MTGSGAICHGGTETSENENLETECDSQETDHCNNEKMWLLKLIISFKFIEISTKIQACNGMDPIHMQLYLNFV